MKTFLSIGSGPGIGAATAERFAREGFRVILTSRDRAKLAERVDDFVVKGYEAEARTADAGDLASIAALIDDVEGKFGSVDVLHFNSAALHDGTIDQQEAAMIIADLTVNIGAALVAVKKVSAGMLARGSGTILLTGGMFAVTPNPNFLTLGIGKAGIRNLTQSLFESLKESGVHIAQVNVATMVAADSKESHGVAEAFWDLHDSAPDSWVAEVTFPA